MNFGIKLRNSECNVITFSPDERTDIIEQLYKTTYNHKNYDKLDWFQFDAISVLLNANNIVGFSSIWNRPFYKKDECRILNRYWEDKCLRREGRELVRDHIVKMVKDQLTFAKKIGYNSAFISREKNPRVFTELINKIADKTNTVWNIHNDRVLVCEGTGCLQYKGYTEL